MPNPSSFLSMTHNTVKSGETDTQEIIGALGGLLGAYSSVSEEHDSSIKASGCLRYSGRSSIAWSTEQKIESIEFPSKSWASYA